MHARIEVVRDFGISTSIKPPGIAIEPKNPANEHDWL